MIDIRKDITKTGEKEVQTNIEREKRERDKSTNLEKDRIFQKTKKNKDTKTTKKNIGK